MKNNFRALYIILIPLIIWAVIKLYFHSQYSLTGDEAEYMNNAWRVYSGGLPYRDFWLLFPPGEVYLPALFFHIIGVNLNLIFYSNIITSLLAVFLFWLVLRELKCAPLFALLAGLFLVLQGEYFFFSALTLLSCYFLLRYDSKENTLFLIVSGLVAGIALLFRIYQVAPYCIAALSFLLIRRKSTGEKVKDGLILIFSASIPILITAIFLWKIDGEMFYATVVDAVSHGTSMHVAYWNEIADNWNKLLAYYDYSHTNPAAYPLRGMLLMLTRFLSGLLLRMVPFIVLIAYVTEIISTPFNSSFNRKALFIIWGIFYLPYAINLSGTTHIIQAYLPFSLLLYMYMYRAFGSIKFRATKYLLISCLAVILFISSVTLYEIFKPANYKHYALATSTDSFSVDDKETYETLQGIINTISANTRKNDFIFSLAWNAPPFYALTMRQDPTYYDSPIDLLLRPARWKEDNIINDLQRKKPKVVIVETNIELISGLSFDTANTLPVLMGFIKSNYKLNRHYTLFDVYLLK